MASPKQPGPTADPNQGRGMAYRVLQNAMGRVRRNPIKSLIALEVAAVVAYRMTREKPDDDEKKQVLVLPFHRMKLVEKKDKSLRTLLRNNLDKSTGPDEDDSTPIVMEVGEVISLIHKASEDPNIVALYGTFGQGFGFEAGGWAHVEEVRNALQVFRESHRVHKEPNLNHNATLQRHSNGNPKPLYAFADTFASPAGDGGTKEYYLASAFTHISLQPQGDLTLFGLGRTELFFKDTLKKYGIKVHVFKHGAYKNAPNIFTENKYTPSHRENVQNILVETNKYVHDAIYTSRRLSTYNGTAKSFWPIIHQAGSLSAEMAQKVGFVDYMPLLDPLGQLLSSNKSPEAKKLAKEKWGKSLDLDQFSAEKSITIDKYAAKVEKKEAAEAKKWAWHKRFQTFAQKGGLARNALALAGYSTPNFNIDESEFSAEKLKMSQEKIALIKIDEAISDSTAKKVKRMLRKLKDSDAKAVVVRINSPGGSITACETIYQELRDLPQRYIVSFGNVSASGGYYISAPADRIFASPTTVTGSIGVFLMKLDLLGLASQYGVKASSITTGDLSNSFDPFFPMNSRMRNNFESYADRAYLRFKSLVADGRQMNMEDVERVAQGRVWTGEQARQNGLVDELGGLDRAIAYAQRNYTETGNAKVVSWPPEKDLMGKLNDFMSDSKSQGFVTSLMQLYSDMVEPVGISEPELDLGLAGLSLPSGVSQPMLTVDENWALRCVLEANKVPQIWKDYPASFWQ